jgi:hypothetical protein
MSRLVVVVAAAVVCAVSGCTVETSSCGPAGCTSSRSGVFTNQAVGESCASDGECAGSMLCATSWPGGYCFQGCCRSTCPSGGRCVMTNEGDVCLKSCTSSTGCRPGYICAALTNGAGSVCVPP